MAGYFGGAPCFAASGTIHTSRVVKLASTTGTLPTGGTSTGVATVVECDTTGIPFGVSQEGCLFAPGLSGTDETIAANTTYPSLHVYVLGDVCWVTVDPNGLPVTAGQRLKVVTSDGQVGPVLGAGVGGGWTIGMALESAAPGKVVKVFIDPQQVAVPQS